MATKLCIAIARRLCQAPATYVFIHCAARCNQTTILESLEMHPSCSAVDCVIVCIWCGSNQRAVQPVSYSLPGIVILQRRAFSIVQPTFCAVAQLGIFSGGRGTLQYPKTTILSFLPFPSFSCGIISKMLSGGGASGQPPPSPTRVATPLGLRGASLNILQYRNISDEM